MTTCIPKLVWILVALPNALACAGERHPAPSDEPIASRSNLRRDSVRVVGYQHTVECSRFRIGQGETSSRSFRFDRLAGDEGAFARGPHGVTLSVPNAAAPSTVAEPFQGTADDHSQRVLSYFVDECGLPKWQVGETQISAMMEAGGTVADQLAGKQIVPHFRGYTTIVERAVEGVAVRGSYAWARFNSHDDVVSEEVFWPDLPDQLLEEALSLQADLATTTKRKEYVAKLPPEYHDATPNVILYHSPHFQDELEAFVAVEFEDDGSMRAFDRNGLEARFMFQRASSSNQAPRFKAL
jgi:hypothetical protein